MRRRSALPDDAVIACRLIVSAAADALLEQLLGRLRDRGYRFVPPTPETHRRFVARREAAGGIRDVLGSSLPFPRSVLPQDIFDLLQGAGMLEGRGSHFRSKVRVASLGDSLFLHSAYPTDDPDSVFFGPDSYRFVNFLERELAGRAVPANLVDIGTGSGVGGICAAKLLPGVGATLIDINPLALRFARVNARHNRVAVAMIEGSGVGPVRGPIELAISNPPFIMDKKSRAYRDGGDMRGAGLSLQWALATAAKLAPGGRTLLYTGSAIVGGSDLLEEALRAQLPKNCGLRYTELDPDIFGEQIDEPGYEEVERIAAVGAVIERLE